MQEEDQIHNCPVVLKKKSSQIKMYAFATKDIGPMNIIIYYISMLMRITSYELKFVI